MMEDDKKMYTRGFTFYGSDGNVDTLRIEEEIDGDGIVVSISNAGKISTIRLSNEQWNSVSSDLRYKF